ncbi:hypothetical protein [Halapricum hydrolyticum]|uniref:DUF4013 domain-containing protein n=1 Tax=Halapricum hydrolyticum TaxID=2979991 RepID=A0AAE3IG73_9EURY|nr:hypothetical protein [Halapricum hydrolyticum]MCU4718817.1 hypothetical protein [Halapricum hydrolyticum]MCU4727775.1 hypothetical protein [Halapricum hydrolyticum]
MVEYGEYVSEGVDHLDELAALLAFPVLLSLLNQSAIRTVVSHRGQYFGITFPFPAPIADLWTFVSLPSIESASVETVRGVGSMFPPSAIGVLLAGMIGYAVLRGVFVAAYLGSIAQYRQQGTYDVIANVRRFTGRYVALSLLLFGVFALNALLVLLSVAFVLVTIPVVLAVTYLFWGAWFLVCTTDDDTFEALWGSYRLAIAGSEYVRWSVFHLLVSAAFSIFVSGLVVNGGFVGILLGLVVAVPVGFVLTVASLRVIEDIAPSDLAGHSQPSPSW